MEAQRAVERTWPRAVLLIALPVLVVATCLVAVLFFSFTVDDIVLVVALNATTSSVVGALILWRRPGHRMGRLLMVVGLTSLASLAVELIAIVLGPSLERLTSPVVAFLQMVLFTTSVVVGSIVAVVRFPSGRRTSRLGLAIEVIVAGAIAMMIVAELVPATAFVLEEMGAAPAFVAFPLAALDLALRYRRATSVERAQFRWLIAAASVCGLLVILLMVVGDRYPWLWTAWIASTVLPTIAIGIAVLRYRLYDIDHIVSRSLTYGAITIVLFVVFFGTNVLLQNVIQGFVDVDAIATALSTLVVASLFQPVRRRIQRVVDRRFHRARYDADRTVASFAGRVRDSVDLPRLVADLRQTAGAAVEPASAVVWLRGSER